MKIKTLAVLAVVSLSYCSTWGQAVDALAPDFPPATAGIIRQPSVLVVTNVTAHTNDTIYFKNVTVTFTNLQSVVYSNVSLSKANLDGITYFCDSGGGFICYTNLTPALLEKWEIPTNRIQIACQRAIEKAEKDRAYRQEVYERQAAQLKAKQAAQWDFPPTGPPPYSSKWQRGGLVVP